MIKKRLIWQLVPSFLLIAIAAIIAATVYASSAFREFYLDKTRSEMRLFADGIVEQVHQLLDGPESEVDALCKRLGQADDGRLRVTVILPDGKVIGDSDENPANMKDHSDRPEIVAAMQQGQGWILRRSPTLGSTMMYVAVGIHAEQQPLAVVRAAIDTTDIDGALEAFYVKMFGSGLVFALCAAVLSLLIARRISQPIVGMQQVAERFAEGELSLRVPMPEPEELQALARALNKMARQLHERIVTITGQRNEVEAILSSMVEGVIAIDGEGYIVSINRAAARLLAIDVQQAQGRQVEEVVRDVGLQEFARQTLAGQQPEEANISLPLNGGRFFQVHGAGLPKEQNTRSGAVIVLNDMTRIYRLENIRRDFVANVSHELKTPITSIKGFVEALLEGDVTDADQVVYYLKIVEKHADRLNAIIDDLLSLSRLEEDVDGSRLSLEKFDVRAVTESAVELSCIKANEKNIRLLLTGEETVAARINAPLLEQAVVNLVDNAIKYSEPDSSVTVDIQQDAERVTIAVRDTGCGIPQEHISRLFERFYVVDKGRSRKLGGTGLGLAIVKHIAQVHGGSTAVESELGQGSTFSIHLPAT
ncbi:ATP-binding protein [Planctomycetota bacterium]